MNNIEELAAELKITDVSTDISGVKWFSTGNLNLRELVPVLNRAGARFVTITATELPMNQGFCLEYLWDWNGQLLGFAFYPLGNPCPASTTSAKLPIGSSARSTKSIRLISPVVFTNRFCFAITTASV